MPRPKALSVRRTRELAAPNGAVLVALQTRGGALHPCPQQKSGSLCREALPDHRRPVERQSVQIARIDLGFRLVPLKQPYRFRCFLCVFLIAKAVERALTDHVREATPVVAAPSPIIDADNLEGVGGERAPGGPPVKAGHCLLATSAAWRRNRRPDAESRSKMVDDAIQSRGAPRRRSQNGKGLVTEHGALATATFA
jgi:hypothetical protein